LLKQNIICAHVSQDSRTLVLGTFKHTVQLLSLDTITIAHTFLQHLAPADDADQDDGMRWGCCLLCGSAGILIFMTIGVSIQKAP